ncbi:MAG: hypothetical protein ACI9SI_001906 [Polaribacter sp.]|jgi:hypothetical protein
MLCDRHNVKKYFAVLEMVLKNSVCKDEPTIHNSDIGLKYCSNEY